MNTASKEVIRLSAAAVSGAHASHPSGRAIQSTTEHSPAASGQVQVSVRAIGSGPQVSRSGPNQIKGRCGTIVRRRYRLDSQTIRSELGEHYAAFDLLRRKPCCIKLARTDAGLTALADARLRSEARILARLSHPNIMEACEFNQDEAGMSFLVLESVEGHSLKKHLQNKGRLPLSEAMEILRGICSGLGRAHEVGIVHGNLHPGSILLCDPRKDSGQGQAASSLAGSVKLTHFELACELGVCTEEQDALPPYVLVGSLPYRAPEALVGDVSGLSPRSDIWSIAVVMYQLLSGRLPFAEEDTRKLSEEISFSDPVPLSALVTDLPKCVGDAIMTALSKSRCLRFATAGEFLRAMEGKATPTDADAQQKGGPTGLFQVTPRLLAECRAQPLSQDAVPSQVTAEHSTRRYPREDYPRDLIEETALNEEQRQTASTVPPAQSEEAEGGGRLFILSLALLSILLGSVFAMGFVIVKRVRHAMMLSEQTGCVEAQSAADDVIDAKEVSGEAGADPALIAMPASQPLASLIRHPDTLHGSRASAPVFADAHSVTEPSWVPVAPPPVALAGTTMPKPAQPESLSAKEAPLAQESLSAKEAPLAQESPLPKTDLLPSASVRSQPTERREKKIQPAYDPDLDALPPPADAPPFATEHKDSPAAMSPPDSQPKGSADASP